MPLGWPLILLVSVRRAGPLIPVIYTISRLCAQCQGLPRLFAQHKTLQCCSCSRVSLCASWLKCRPLRYSFWHHASCDHAALGKGHLVQPFRLARAV